MSRCETHFIQDTFDVFPRVAGGTPVPLDPIRLHVITAFHGESN